MPHQQLELSMPFIDAYPSSTAIWRTTAGPPHLQTEAGERSSAQRGKLQEPGTLLGARGCGISGSAAGRDQPRRTRSRDLTCHPQGAPYGALSRRGVRVTVTPAALATLAKSSASWTAAAWGSLLK